MIPDDSSNLSTWTISWIQEKPMAKINYVKGDLFAALSHVEWERNIVVPHVCNNARSFGAGFVIPLKKTFPLAEKKYKNWRKWRGLKLGTTQFVEVAPSTVVANMIAQDNLGDNYKRPLVYPALVKCMETVGEYAVKHRMEIFAPKFGAGIAGGSWPFIEELIQDCWIARGINTTIFYL